MWGSERCLRNALNRWNFRGLGFSSRANVELGCRSQSAVKDAENTTRLSAPLARLPQTALSRLLEKHRGAAFRRSQSERRREVGEEVSVKSLQKGQMMTFWFGQRPRQARPAPCPWNECRWIAIRPIRGYILSWSGKQKWKFRFDQRVS